MGKVIRSPHIADEWELDGRLLGHGDWIEVFHGRKWILAKIDIGFSPPLLKLVTDQDIRIKEGIEARFLQSNSIDSGDTEIYRWPMMKGKRAESLQRLKAQIEGAGHLIICDVYFLMVRNTSQLAELIDILPISTLRELEIFCGTRRYYNQQVERNLRQKLEPLIKVSVFPNDKIHDRFWITDKGKAWSVGTSFNSIGYKLAVVLELTEEDLRVIQRDITAIKNQLRG